VLQKRQLFKYQSIEQFRHCIKMVQHRTSYIGKDENDEPIYDWNLPKPTLTFTGTVKLHGTNASICLRNGFQWEQSRNNILTPVSDNAGFSKFCSEIPFIITLWTAIGETFGYTKEDEVDIIFGEWCGGNIQGGVAIHGLPKMFVIFEACRRNAEGEIIQYFPKEFVETLKINEYNIYNIYQFPTFTIDIDFNFPEESQQKLIELTQAVENECPVGKYFGKSGVGEGIVWTHQVDEKNLFQFKVVGEKHSKTKVKKLAEVDIDEIKNAQEFVNNVVTENRLKQGLEQIRPEKQYIGQFVKWVVNDVMKEEHDTITNNNLNEKVVISLIQKKASQYILKIAT